MTEREFCYWLQGFFELSSDDPCKIGMSADQVATIREHLKLVFTKVTPPVTQPIVRPMYADGTFVQGSPSTATGATGVRFC